MGHQETPLQSSAEDKDKLIESEENYHKMIEEVEDYAILLLDTNGIIRNWNRGAEKIKGYKEKEIVGNHFRIFYPPADQAARLPEKLIGEAIANGKAVHEGWRVRKDGSSFWGSIVITALHNKDNSITGFSKVTRDLTERKKAEDKLIQYARQLESQNKELQQFAYAAAHDMKEPLRKIQFYNSAILSGGGATLPEKEKSFLTRAVDAAARMQGLIDDLLAFTKIAGELDQFESVDLDSIWKEVLTFYQEKIESSRAAIETRDRLPVIQGIPFQLRQLFTNLLGNSLKYIGQDASPCISLQCIPIAHPFSGYRITIADNGIGFPSEYAEKIFEMFQRLHGREEYPGTGIGLAICRKIVENHQGIISAEGQPGKGATFHVYLPSPS